MLRLSAGAILVSILYDEMFKRMLPVFVVSEDGLALRSLPGIDAHLEKLKRGIFGDRCRGGEDAKVVSDFNHGEADGCLA